MPIELTYTIHAFRFIKSVKSLPIVTIIDAVLTVWQRNDGFATLIYIFTITWEVI